MNDDLAHRKLPSKKHSTTSKSKLHEQSFNLELGKLLRKLSPVWKDSDRRKVETERVNAQRKRPDIVVTTQNRAPVAVEVSYTPMDADRDAKSRIGQRVSNFPVRTAIAIVPPEGTRDLPSEDDVPEFLKGNLLSYAVHFPEDQRFPETGWIEGDLHDFAEFLLAAEIPPSTLNETAQKAKDVISEASNILYENLNQQSLAEIVKAIHEPDPERAVQAAVLCMFNALHAQDAISIASGNPTVLTRNKCRSDTKPHPMLPTNITQSWSAILDIDYQPIYKIAHESLDAACSNAGAASRALSILDKVVDEVLAQGINPGRELAQAIFPLIVQDRKKSAAFYTKSPVASMLLHLTYARKEEILGFSGGGGG